MSSASESSHHLLPSSSSQSSSSSQIKPKLSPLDLGNTDLVSRLLAATPPYLYNMSLLPNTYFFSEMLRNLVQARNEKQNSNQFYGQQQMRRSRKRAWNNRESFSSSTAMNNHHHQHHHHHHQHQQSSLSSSPAEIIHLDKPSEKLIPSESASSTSWMMLKNMKKCDEHLELTQQNNNINNNNNKPDESSASINNNILLFNPPSSSSASSSSLQETTNNLTLPPPPPIWYPPIYPNHPPYGIDPLHFFIDLRVSGHNIQNQINNNNHNNNKDESKSTIVKNQVQDQQQQQQEEEEEDEKKLLENNLHHHHHHHQQGMIVLKSKRNSLSAFSVPHQTNKTKKFDIKSMMGPGFDHNDKTINNNKRSLNYIMGNLPQVYKNIHINNNNNNNNNEEAEEEAQKKCVDDDEINNSINVESMNNDEELLLVENEQKIKAKNDLRALIGLELVVDYMSHKKKGVEKIEEPSSSSSEAEGAEEAISEMEFCGSPPLEVVALNEES